jgi:hypothetical protein
VFIACAGREKGGGSRAFTGSACKCLPRVAKATREGVTQRTPAWLNIAKGVGSSLLVGRTATVGGPGHLLGGVMG